MIETGLRALGATLLVCWGLAGCNSAPSRDPAFAPVRPDPPPVEAPKPTRGSIYAATGRNVGYEVNLFRDHRAHRVGDILTVQLVEKTEAQKETETNVDKKTDYNIANPTILGNMPNLKVPGTNDRVTLGADLNSDNSFEGSGDSSQSNKLSGEITVSVAEVMANGNLRIQGEKILNLNRGNEYVRLSGIVRPQDITSENTVPSTRVANATIVYSGDGAVADAGKLGWLARFFISAVWPF